MRFITAERAQSYQCNTRRVAASGVLTRAAEGRQIAEFVRTNDGGIFAGENGEREPPRRVSGRRRAEQPGEERWSDRGETQRAAPTGCRRRDPWSVHVTLLFVRGCRGCGPCRRGCR